MNILFVCHRFPYPPKRGGKIRPFNIIRHLSSEGHRVTVASLARDAQEARDAKGIAPHCHAFHVETVGNAAAWTRMLLRLATPWPSSMGYFYSPELAQRINGLLGDERFDLIFVHCSSVAQYVSDVEGIPKILDFGDMDSQKWLAYSGFKPFPLSLGYWLEGRKMARAERQLAARFDTCTATTRAELATLQGICDPGKTDWFPNGVDREYFRAEGGDYDRDTICFVGRMDYYPNQQAMFRFCAQVWPKILARRPSTRLQIVGADPSRAVRELGELEGVAVTGSVPDVRPFLRNCALTVAPLEIARGTQNKILESLALGVPVVCSPIAADGVDVEVGTDLLAADSDDAFADAVLRVLEDPELRATLSACGVRRMASHHDWAKSMQRVDRIIAATMERAS